MRYFLIISFAFILFACGQEEQARSIDKNHDHPMAQESTKLDKEKIIYYTCPMKEHKHVHSAEKGNCPECDMTLVAGVVTTEENREYYGCPMEIHSHVRSDQSGTCDDCGMALKPMRLIKK